MKINKLLVEDVEEIDVDSSVGQIADEVIDASDGEFTPEEAEEIATEIKEVGDTVEAEEAVFIDGYNEKTDALETKNVITDLLDRALAYALKQQKLGQHSMGNVLISGLPGSGKTAIVENWCRARGVNMIEINAKDNDLEAFINGFTVRDDEDRKAVTKAFSNTLDDLKREDKNHVIFLDELNRQTKDQIRGSLLTLINNKTIQANVPGGKHYFKTLLFTVACINPHVKGDPGAAKLFQAEKTRYLFKNKNAHSDSKTADDFLHKYYDRLISKLNPKHPNYRQTLEDFLRIQHLGRFIVNHRDFNFDGEGSTSLDDLQQMLQDLDSQDADMLNQRMLFELLKASDGTKQGFSLMLDSADFLEDNMEMLRNILDDYYEPTFEDLCAAKGIDPNGTGLQGTAASETVDDETVEGDDGDDDDLNFDDYDEDDDTLFTNANTAGASYAVSPSVVKDKIVAALKNW